jgi:3-oxoacyl-[acyl-carrier-protein] synthase-3
MNGREVYRFATRVMGKAAKQACDKAGVTLDEIDLLIPHQANIRIIESASDYLKINRDKVFTNLDRYGNTSAASIPIALCEAIESGRVNPQDKIVMVGFGGGLTWGATVVQWGIPLPEKQRDWRYKTARWMLYRWAKVLSTSKRLSRWIDGVLVDEENKERRQPIKEKTKEEKVKTHRNGHGPKPEPLESPLEAPLIKPVEADEVVPTLEKPLNGK